MPFDVPYIDFFPRHSFGDVPLMVYSQFNPVEPGKGLFRLKSENINESITKAFLVPVNFWGTGSEEGMWKTLNFFKQAVVSGSLVEGQIIKTGNDLAFKADMMISGSTILSKCWGSAGTRHVDFVERAVPIPEDESGFHDYIRRWRERELKDQGFFQDDMEPETYHDQFMKIRGPIRYHLFLQEEADNEPECYFEKGKLKMPKGFPVFEDLCAEKMERLKESEYWGPIWLDPEYPHEKSMWIWTVNKDNRMKSRVVLSHRSGMFSIMLIPFYFSFVL